MLRIKAARRTASSLLRDKGFATGFLLFASLLAISFYGQVFIPADYAAIGTFRPSQPPGGVNVLGTDSFGRDVFVILAHSIANSLVIGITTAIIATFVGSFVGFVAGYYGGVPDAIIRVVIDTLLSIPSLLLLLLIASFMKATLTFLDISLVISLFFWASPARQVRAQVLSLKEREFINVAKLSGMKGYQIIIYEIMPHMLQWVSANFVTATLSAIMTESTLSLLGLGPQRSMTLGMMLFWTLNYAALYRGLWWWWMSPVFTLVVLFFSMYILHLGIDRILGLRGREK